MKTRHYLAAVVCVLAMLLTGCESEIPAPEAAQTVPGEQAEQPLMTPKATATATTAPGVILRVDDRDLWAPLLGTVKAYVLRDASQLMPGLLADGFLGDLVLENDLVRFVVRRPDPSLPVMPPGGAIIDVANSKSKADYLNYYQPIPDVESTTTKIKYEAVGSFLVDRQTTVRLVLRGKVVEEIGVEETTGSKERALPISVTTTYELPKNEPYLVLRTRFTNDSSEPVSLMPGDYIDWGEATSFVEGWGFAPAAFQPTNWIGATIDDFSAGVCVPGHGPILGVTSGRFSVIQAFGKMGAVKRPPAMVSSAPSVKPASTPGVMETPPPPTSFHIRPSAVPPVSTQPPPPVETRYSPRRELPVRPIPKRETNFSPLFVPPRAETKYSMEIDDATRTRRSALGGGALSHNEPAGNENQPNAPQISDTGRVTLYPGQSIEFVRYLVIADRNLARLGRTVYRLKGIPTARIAGAVLEEGTNAPVGGAEIRISGGPSWDGKSQQRAFIRAITKDDGTFSLRLPYGTYHVTAHKIGCTLKGGAQIVKLFRKSSDQVLAFLLSKPAVVRVAVSDPDAATSVGLPCRITLIPKPGTPPPDWGFGPHIASGVRNIFYAPYGGAVMPVSPGQYRLVISRGVEYEAVEQDIVVTESSNQTIAVTLPRAWKMPGTISADIGVMTTASAVGLITPEDVVVMAACEGVSVLVSGDYDRATDLSLAINRLNLRTYVKAFAGMRMLVHGRGLTANVLVYPVNLETQSKLREFRAKHGDVAPDIFLADLRKEFPDLVIQIDQPLHPLAGYLASFPFDSQFKRFEEGNVPPPDFHAMQILNGKVVGDYDELQARYFDMVVKRTRWPEPAPALTPLGSSMCRLPYGTEVGYPRVYLYTTHDTLDRFTSDDLTQAIKGQHIVVTNSLFPQLNAYMPSNGTFQARAGDVVDTGTTGGLPLKINIYAASWVSFSNFDITWNGKAVRRIQAMPVKRVLRYPVRSQKDADRQIVYVTSDGFTNLVAYSSRRALSPVVPPAPEDFGGDVWPISWTGPIFIDQDRNGRVVIPAEDEMNK